MKDPISRVATRWKVRAAEREVCGQLLFPQGPHRRAVPGEEEEGRGEEVVLLGSEGPPGKENYFSTSLALQST